MKFVARGDPFHKIAEPPANPEPFTVRVNAAPPACVDDGVRLLIAGCGVPAKIVKAELLDTVPFVLTVTLAVPCVAMRLESTIPVNCAPLPNIVASGDPFHKIAELAANPEPFTVRVNAAPPACVDDGLRLLMVAVPGAIVKFELFDTVPAVLTVTTTVPCAVIRLAPIGPVN